jgi:hypothetical protein
MIVSLAKAQMPDDALLFGYKGWAARTLFIQNSVGENMATVKSLSWWNRDTALTIDGTEYIWKQKNGWGTRCGWFGPAGEEIMEFQMRWWGKVDIHSPALADKTTMLLLFFGMYLIKLHEMDAAAAGS